MKILFDTNVILDLLLERKPFAHTATKLVDHVEKGKIQGALCATTITTVHYLAVKSIGVRSTQHAIAKLLALFEIAPVHRLALQSALDSKFSDFEDAVIYHSARQINAQGIVTRNVKDFKKVTLRIYTPQDLFTALQVIERRDENEAP